MVRVRVVDLEGVCVGIGVRERVCMGVGEWEGVGDRVEVYEEDGKQEPDAVAVEVGGFVDVAEGVAVGNGVRVCERDDVGESVPVDVGIAVGVAVGVTVVLTVSVTGEQSPPYVHCPVSDEQLALGSPS